jgi:N12 class adenine-specific DNA methylase
VSWRVDPAGQPTPSGPLARIEANLAALEVLATLRQTDRAASSDEQALLARWSSWGAVPQIFDDISPYAEQQARLRALLTKSEWDAAALTTINAHYTQPSFAAAIWQGLVGLGFAGGTVLEPGCGSGTFISLAPEGAQMIGVELDPTTAAITRHLHPEADIRTESFADTRLSKQVDAVVGNVPFADVRLHDPAYNAAKLTMHNHFIVKSLALTKPGGVVAVLTSRYTLDAKNPTARRELAELGELVGAVRFPTGAHSRTAGTDVITDLLVLRRHEGPAPETAPAWERTSNLVLNDHEISINQYFQEHPAQILGTLSAAIGRFGPELVVKGPVPADQTLASAVQRIVDHGHANSLTWNPAAPGDTTISAAAQIGDAPSAFVGHINEIAPGVFTTRGINGSADELTISPAHRSELGKLLGLRDITLQLLQTEAANLDDIDEVAALRTQLNTAYDEYLIAHGPLNRFTLRRTGRVDNDGNDKMSQIRPPIVAKFATDPHSQTIFALENFDAETQTAHKAAIFRTRVIAPRIPVSGAETPQDAIAVALDTEGKLNLPTLARLLGDDEKTARSRLGALVFDDPATGALVSAAEYLSGDVRTKLATARQSGDPQKYQVNIDALAAIVPADLVPGEIDARLGASWIGRVDVEDFLRETLQSRSVSVQQIIGSKWKVDSSQMGVLEKSTWGTENISAGKIAEHLLCQKPIRIIDYDSDGKRVFDPVATSAAEAKAQELNERFSEWVWEKPERADRLTKEYNQRFNNIVLRSYADTDHLTLPGLASNFTPRKHQLEAVARMIAEPAAGLYHEVGAGKTAEMAIGVMEMRRLGLVRKPAIIVPNHMLNQFGREFLHLYPQARILAASINDLTADRRKLFVARAATDDWDAIIMTRTAFERLPVSKAESEEYRKREIGPLRDALQRAAATAGGSTQHKQIQKQILAIDEKFKALMDKAKDVGISFEQTGIDYLVVDELHDYKNLSTVSNIPDAKIAGSGRATDLHMKVEFLRRTHGGRCMTGATATPIANSVTEAYVMQRFLRPDLLTNAGITDFDTWAGTFGETVTDIEMPPDGGGWRMKTRFARFRNVPELLQMWHVAADVKTAADLNLPTPAFVLQPGGERGPETIVVKPSEETKQYMLELGKRADRVRSGQVEPKDDNMLSISSDGRAAALDIRLLSSRTVLAGQAFPGALSLFDDANPPTKIEVAADNISDIWRENEHTIYADLAGDPHPRPGALQIVFCDLGTPGDGWNVYRELKDQLAAKGVPDHQIAFIHDAQNSRDKDRLFEKCRTGQIQVLIGSTAKMGVGTNVQARAIAEHHLDCPWRPADLAQRDGRIMRQGNQNKEIRILRYVTEGTFDTYLWQTVERKAGFINQIMRGRLDSREIEDVGATALDYNEVKALASGDPSLLVKAKAEAEVNRLGRLKRAHATQVKTLNNGIEGLIGRIASYGEKIPLMEQAIDRRRSTVGSAFAMTVHGTHHTGRQEAADALKQHLRNALPENKEGPIAIKDLGAIGELGGLPMIARVGRASEAANVIISIDQLPGTYITVTHSDVRGEGRGIINQLENRVAGLDQTLAELRSNLQTDTQELSRAQTQLTAPFKHETALLKARAEVARINGQLEAASEPERAPGTPTAHTPNLQALAEKTRALTQNIPTKPQQNVPTTPGPAPLII